VTNTLTPDTDLEITWVTHESGDDDPFDRWVLPEVDFVKRVTRRMSRTNADAEDLAQEVLANAYRGIERFDGRYPRAWLYRIASNAAASRARKRAPLLTVDGGDETFDALLPEEATPEAAVVDPVMDADLVNALSDLPDHYRDVIDLVDVAGSSYEAAAETLDIPIGTVMSRLHRGRRRLREALAGSHLDRSGRHQVAAPV
jgi:RNA polymerase sigma-70 factor, ECF subfamily